MGSLTSRLKPKTWYQWAFTVCLFLYLVYLSISWFYLPDKLTELLEKDVSAMIDRDIAVSNISFNPFKLSLEIKDLSVSSKDNEPLLSWDNLLVNFGALRSIFLFGIVFDEIYLDNSYINIEKLDKGFNFSDIIERLSSPDPDKDMEEKKEGRRIAVKLFNISLNRGSFKYTDKSGVAPATASLNDLSLHVRELYFATGDEHLNTFAIETRDLEGGELLLNGNYRIDPLYMEGHIKADKINLARLSSFLENVLPVSIGKGTLSLDTNILIKNNSDLDFKIDKGNLEIKGLNINDHMPDPAMLNAGGIGIENFSIDITGKKITAENVLFDNFVVNQWVNAEGVPRYSALLLSDKPENAGEKQAGPDRDENAVPWDILAKQLCLKNSTINFEDQRHEIMTGHVLSDINIELREISIAPESRIPVNLAALINSNGEINVQGFLTPLPFSVELEYRLDKLLLNHFTKYLEAATWLKIADGTLFTEGKVSVDIEGDTINASTNMDMNNLRIKDLRSDDPVFSLNRFMVNDLKAEVNNRKITAASVSLLKPDLAVSLSEKKDLNLSDMIKENDKVKDTEPPQAKADASDPWKFKIDKVSMDDGTVLFSDKSVEPEYRTGMYNMALSIEAINSESEEVWPFSLSTDIDKYAPFTIKGSLDPLKKQPGFAFTSTLNGLEMTHLSPYSGVYIGSYLKSGKLSLDLDYTLHDRKLNGDNNIVAKNLYLGERLAVEPVINAPVRLGLALLRDISGVIDLDVNISGDLDDPGFSVAGIIIKTLVNIIVKAAASPFMLLASLVPDGGKEMGDISFDPGSPLLNLAEKEKLTNLVEALDQRPQLILSIKGNASRSEDTAALKTAHLIKILADKRGIEISVIHDELKTQNIWMITENHSALEAISKEMGLPDIAERLKKTAQAAGPEKAQGLSHNPEAPADENAIYREIHDDINKAVNISDNELISLADERALMIKQYLVDEVKLSHERVSVIKTSEKDLTGVVITMGIDAM